MLLYVSFMLGRHGHYAARRLQRAAAESPQVLSPHPARPTYCSIVTPLLPCSCPQHAAVTNATWVRRYHPSCAHSHTTCVVLFLPCAYVSARALHIVCRLRRESVDACVLPMRLGAELLFLVLLYTACVYYRASAHVSLVRGGGTRLAHSSRSLSGLCNEAIIACGVYSASLGRAISPQTCG